MRMSAEDSEFYRWLLHHARLMYWDLDAVDELDGVTVPRRRFFLVWASIAPTDGLTPRADRATRPWARRHPGRCHRRVHAGTAGRHHRRTRPSPSPLRDGFDVGVFQQPPTQKLGWEIPAERLAKCLATGVLR